MNQVKSTRTVSPRSGFYRAQWYLGVFLMIYAALLFIATLVGAEHPVAAFFHAVRAGLVPLLLGILFLMSGHFSEQLLQRKDEVRQLTEENDRLKSLRTQQPEE